MDYSLFNNLRNHQNNIINSSNDIIDTDKSLGSNCPQHENKVKANDGINIQPNDKDERSIEYVNEKIALFENVAVYKGKNNLLYSPPKVGKSYFSIEIAKNENKKNPYFIILEDYSSDQKIRYSKNLNGKYFNLISLDDFDDTYDNEYKAREK